MSHKPTGEQADIVDAAATGADLTVEAGAGTGKTSTLKMLAVRVKGRGVYLAYNKAIATEAAASFPASVNCRTAHSFAYGAVGRQFAHRLKGPRVTARQAAEIMRLREPVKIGQARFAPEQIARLVNETIQAFCYSAEERIGRMQVPLVKGLDKPGQAELARYLVPLAQKAWDVDLTQREGRLRFTHDAYLKIWALSRPQLHADYVLLDEAQDSNPAVAGIVTGQEAQKILVGDRNQAIYGWRGATDAMATFPGKRLYLSQSFRFGQVVADEANKWLGLLDAPLRLTGYAMIPSRIEPLIGTADAILCRTNGGALARAMSSLATGRRTGLVGGGSDIRRLAEAAQQLQAGRPTDHPELFAFSSWREVVDYADNDPAGSDLKVFVRLVDKHGADELIRVCNALVDERRADLVISTAHRSKGREWDRVAIADDFQEPKPNEEGEARLARDEAMLAYVAVTRAQQVLDRSGLAWVDRWVDGTRTPAPSSSTSWLGAAVVEHPEAILPDGPELLSDVHNTDDEDDDRPRCGLANGDTCYCTGRPGCLAINENEDEDGVDELDGIGQDYRSDPAQRIAAVAAIAPEYVRRVELAPVAVEWTPPRVPPPTARRPCEDCDHLTTRHLPTRGRVRCVAPRCGCTRVPEPAGVA